MNPTRPRVAPALLALAAACLAPAATARAQGFGPDPFRPYNSQYDPYVFGVPPGPLDGVGNPTINRQGVRNANQFREAMEGLDNSNRYDRSFRAYDQDRKRVYRPNAEADKNYDARRTKASDIYFQYLYEKDPRKRAALFKEYNQARSDIAKGLTTDPNARGGRRGRGADAVPAAPRDRDAGAGAGAKDGSIPAAPEGSRPRARSGSASRSRKPSDPAGVPPAPAGDEPTPSEVLDRASRAGAAPAAPATPRVP